MAVVYRMYSPGGDLLYVGATGNWITRIDAHKVTQSWWDEVATIKIEHHADERSALESEWQAIAAERPRYNRRVNSKPPASTGTIERRPLIDGAALIEARVAARMTQAELAQATGICHTTISRLESGKRCGTPAQLKAIREALNVSFEFLRAVS